jgi:membrane protein implicated in regulation of membrane protease activity
VATGAFVLAWIVAALSASWLFGSGNILVWVIAGFAGVTVYLASARWRTIHANTSEDP